MVDILVDPVVEKKFPMNVYLALRDIRAIFSFLEKDIDSLPIVTFDPQFTKPVDLNSIEIMSQALAKDMEITIKLYKQDLFVYKFMPVNAHVKLSEPNVIYINERMFNRDRSVQEWKETLFHELIHVFDHYSSYRFDHGKNSLKGKDQSAPVKLATILSSMDLSQVTDEQLIW